MARTLQLKCQQLQQHPVAFTSTASPVQAAPMPSERTALEETWQLTGAERNQQLLVAGLGVANLLGVLILSGMLADYGTRMALARSSLAIVAGAMPALQVSAFCNKASKTIYLLVTAHSCDLFRSQHRASCSARAMPDLATSLSAWLIASTGKLAAFSDWGAC